MLTIQKINEAQRGLGASRDQLDAAGQSRWDWYERMRPLAVDAAPLQPDPAPLLRWVSIDTAPKDGSVILVNDTTGGSPWASAKWVGCEEWSGWVYDDEMMNDSSPLGPNPTQWLQGLAAVGVNAEASESGGRPVQPADRESVLKTLLADAVQAMADARLAGRAEALSILLNVSAEAFCEIYVGSESLGESGELSPYWREQKLKDLFDLSGEFAMTSLIGRLQSAFWDQENKIDELRDRLRNGPRKINSLDEFFAEAALLNLTVHDLVPALRERPEFAVEAAEADAASALSWGGQADGSRAIAVPMMYRRAISRALTSSGYVPISEQLPREMGLAEQTAQRAMMDFVQWCDDNLDLLQQGRKYGFRLGVAPAVKDLITLSITDPMHAARVVGNLHDVAA